MGYISSELLPNYLKKKYIPLTALFVNENLGIIDFSSGICSFVELFEHYCLFHSTKILIHCSFIWLYQDIVEAIHNETQMVDPHTGSSVHNALGMFTLVIMTHGCRGYLSGKDGTLVSLVDIYKMISSRNFPAMAGKPKLVILLSCNGSKLIKFTFLHSSTTPY